MSTPLDPGELERRRNRIRGELSTLGDLRPGSLVDRYRKCGKPNCHCAAEEAGGHGPSWSLTRQLGGKTITKIIPVAAVPQTRQQIAEYQRFRRLARELVEASEQLCDAKLGAPEATAPAAAKKGASKKPSTRQSRPRSKRS
jgi:hypothetical protein